MKINEEGWSVANENDEIAEFYEGSIFLPTRRQAEEVARDEEILPRSKHRRVVRLRISQQPSTPSGRTLHDAIAQAEKMLEIMIDRIMPEDDLSGERVLRSLTKVKAALADRQKETR